MDETVLGAAVPRICAADISIRSVAPGSQDCYLQTVKVILG